MSKLFRRVCQMSHAVHQNTVSFFGERLMDTFKHMFLFFFGGTSYLVIELLWRGYTHRSMLIVGGLCFVLLGIVKEIYNQNIPFVIQMIMETFIITILEFVSGCILNLWLHLNVWNYSGMPFNILGQICLPYMGLWFLLSPLCIFADDYIRYFVFNEDKPHYTLI